MNNNHARHIIRTVALNIFFVLLFLNHSFSESKSKVFLLKVDGSINPSTADYISDELQKASNENAQLVIVQLNTPGGLLKSTRVIVSDFLNSQIPIAIYVSPSGSQAASAGVFITLSAHFAVMAPGTNIGAAHPVSGSQSETIDSIMMGKITNDAAAFIRTIAEKRNRNVTWAEEAVRKSVSITETEALKKNVIDFIAPNIQSLLDSLNGKEVIIDSKKEVLQTKNCIIVDHEMGWQFRLLDILSDPNIAYLLMMLGFYGILFELYNPGAILPGVVGGISLILAFYSLHTLPVNYAGLGLIIFGIILFILEIKVVSHGILAVGGTISLFLGSVMLIRVEPGLEFLQLSWFVILPMVICSTIFFVFILGLGLRAQRKKIQTGREGLVKSSGIAYSDLNPDGKVQIHGELWNAVSISGTISKGSVVQVVKIEKLTLYVEEKNNS